MTPWVSRLLMTNVLVFFALRPETLLYALLMLFPPAVLGLDQVLVPAMPFRPWGLVTYMFLHANLGHVFWNMVMLFFFGPRVESRLGARGFLALYFLSGVGGGLFSLAFSFNVPVVGASAAVYGVVIGFAMFWPREPIYIWGVLPVQARWLAVAFIALSLFSSVSGSDGTTAHFAHLGGLAVGAGYLRWRDWRLGKNRREFRQKVQHSPSMDGSHRDARSRWASIDLASMHALNRNEVEELLARVDRSGMSALSRHAVQELTLLQGECAPQPE